MGCRQRSWLSGHGARVKEAVCTKRLLLSRLRAGAFVVSAQTVKGGNGNFRQVKSLNHPRDIRFSFNLHSLMWTSDLLTLWRDSQKTNQKLLFLCQQEVTWWVYGSPLLTESGFISLTCSLPFISSKKWTIVLFSLCNNRRPPTYCLSSLKFCYHNSVKPNKLLLVALKGRISKRCLILLIWWDKRTSLSCDMALSGELNQTYLGSLFFKSKHMRLHLSSWRRFRMWSSQSIL